MQHIPGHEKHCCSIWRPNRGNLGAGKSPAQNSGWRKLARGGVEIREEHLIGVVARRVKQGALLGDAERFGEVGTRPETLWRAGGSAVRDRRPPDVIAAKP